jgi:hypothetical protein
MSLKYYLRLRFVISLRRRFALPRRGFRIWSRLGLCRWRGRRLRRRSLDPYLGAPEHPLVQPIAGEQHVGDDGLFDVAGLARESLVDVRVENLAHRVEGLEAVLVRKQLAELAPDDDHSVMENGVFLSMLGAAHGPIEIVQNRYEVGEKVRVSVLERLIALAEHAFSKIFIVREFPKILVFERGILFLKRGLLLFESGDPIPQRGDFGRFGKGRGRGLIAIGLARAWKIGLLDGNIGFRFGRLLLASHYFFIPLWMIMMLYGHYSA